MYTTPTEAVVRPEAAPIPQGGHPRLEAAFGYLTRALVKLDTSGTVYNPQPDGVDIMVVDAFNKPLGDTSSDLYTTHGQDTAYVADQASTDPSAEVFDVTFDGFWGLASFLERVAASPSPPEVINLSIGMDPGTMFESKYLTYDRNFKWAHPESPSLWSSTVKGEYKAGIQDLIEESVYEFNSQYEGIPTELKGAFELLVAAGVNVTIASGNSGKMMTLFDSLDITPPSDFFDGTYLDDLPEGVIIVGASTGDGPTDDPAPFTSPMNGVDVAVDGVRVMLNSASGKLGDGTSYAAPQVAGLVADIRAANPSLTPAQVEAILEASAYPLPGEEARVGAGIVDRERALELAEGTSSDALSVTESVMRYLDSWDTAGARSSKDGLINFRDVQAVAAETSDYAADERVAAQYLVSHPDLFDQLDSALDGKFNGHVSFKAITAWQAAQASA